MANPPALNAGSTEADNDSTLGSDNDSSTEELDPRIEGGCLENGRIYHVYKKGAYLLPSDETEQDRLDRQHHVFRLIFNEGLFTCPFVAKGAQRVLDVGTGTGIWAIDFADKYPAAHVIGIDLSPIQPLWVPSNVEFQIDDIEDPWTFTSPFHFIYCRTMAFGISDWPHFFSQSFKYLQPGGYIEVVDIAFPVKINDESIPANSCLQQWSRYLLAASAKAKKPIDSAKHHKQRLEDAGFKNVQADVYYWPLNEWASGEKYKQLGAWNDTVIGSHIDALSMALFTRELGWSMGNVETFAALVRNEMKNTTIHAFWEIYVVYGQKPMG